MNASDYEKKAEDILGAAPFVVLPSDPTARNERKVNATLKNLLQANEITKKTHDHLRVSENGTHPPLFYGSAKLHTDGAPLRPIVSTIGSSTYKIAKRLNKALAPYAQQANSYVRNTTDFLENLEDVTIDDDGVMVSFDVKSLFTSVPVDDAYAAIEQLVRADDHDGVRERTGMGMEAILRLLKLCMSTTNFKFRNKHYALADGLPMGSPASPVIANIYMRVFEEKALSTFPFAKPKVWYRYVDDVFAIVKRIHVQNLLDHLNRQHPSIRFTVETEREGKLPYLDVRVSRAETGEGRLSIEIYRKPTHSSRYLQFSSHHSDNAKSSVARALFERVSYVTGEEKRKRESGTIEEELKLNNFPHEIIIRERRKAIKKQRERAEGRTASERTTGELETRKKATISIPYIQGTSEAIRRVLGQLGIRTAMRSSKIKWSIMKGVKDKQKEEEIPGVVYAIGCGDCREVYVGETRRTAAQRVKEHKSDTRLGHLDKSAVAEHAHTIGHHVHWKAMVVEREQHGRKRKVKEALHIHRMTRKDGSMNQDRGLHLSKIWLDLVQ